LKNPFYILATYWNLLLKSGELGPLLSQCICTQPLPQVQIWLNLGPKNAIKFGSLTSPGVGFFFQFCGFKSLEKFPNFKIFFLKNYSFKKNPTSPFVEFSS
jgi:hypothetical protein